MHSLWDSLKVMSVVSLDVLSENRKGLTDIASHAGVFRGARGEMKTSSPKNVRVGG